MPPAPRRVVSLTAEEPKFIGVIIDAATGVSYQHQCGGTNCLQEHLEGYFVPVSRLEIDESGDPLGPDRLAFDPDLLRAVFHHPDDLEACWACSTDQLPLDRQQRLAELIDLLCYYGADHAPQSIELDRSRLREGNEACVPVLTPDGRGMLVWNNCD